MEEKWFYVKNLINGILDNENKLEKSLIETGFKIDK